MAASFPYTHYACPCSSSAPAITPRRASSVLPPPQPAVDAEEQPFNPHSPRAAYALYPLDHLLYCDECDTLKCARCYTEEILSWYCPACLFEVPSSAVRSDGNR